MLETVELLCRALEVATPPIYRKIINQMKPESMQELLEVVVESIKHNPCNEQTLMALAGLA